MYYMVKFLEQEQVGTSLLKLQQEKNFPTHA